MIRIYSPILQLFLMYKLIENFAFVALNEFIVLITVMKKEQ
jgi:hypothetical protein